MAKDYPRSDRIKQQIKKELANLLQKDVKDPSLKQITNKNIDNKKLFNMIKKNYEKFLFKTNQNSFSELKKFTQKI